MELLYRTTLLYFSSLLFLNASEWLYYKHYPWVYDDKSKDWLYLSGGSDGKVYAYRNSTKKWGEFSESIKNITDDNSWNEQYEEWIKNPTYYGGLETLEIIKEAKIDNVTELYLITESSIFDLTPVAGLSSLSKLTIGGVIHEFSDLTPLTNLTNLSELYMSGSEITQLTPLTSLPNLKKLGIEYCNNLTDLSPLTEIADLNTLHLRSTSVSDISVLSGLTNLTYLYMPDMTIADITPLTNLINLETLILSLTDVQESTLKVALPNLTIHNP